MVLGKGTSSLLPQVPLFLPTVYVISIFIAAILTSPHPLPALLISRGIRESGDKETKEISLCSVSLHVTFLLSSWLSPGMLP